MSELKCQSVRDSLLTYFAEATMVDVAGEVCGITLPIPTLDGRQVDVFIEPRAANYVLIHDGGKAVNELILQGVKITESVSGYMEALARRFGVSYVDETFQFKGLQSCTREMVMAIGMCSALAMSQLVDNVAAVSEEPFRQQFGSALKTWSRKKMKVVRDVPIIGRRAKHRFDFVGYPTANSTDPIAMSVLLPGSNPLAAAERFGFKATDLDSTPYGKWRRVAIQGRTEMWSTEARKIVKDCADEVIEIAIGATIKPTAIASVLAPLLNKAS